MNLRKKYTLKELLQLEHEEAIKKLHQYHQERFKKSLLSDKTTLLILAALSLGSVLGFLIYVITQSGTTLNDLFFFIGFYLGAYVAGYIGAKLSKGELTELTIKRDISKYLILVPFLVGLFFMFLQLIEDISLRCPY